MELIDFAFPLLRKVNAVTDVDTAFENATAVIILDKGPDSESSHEATITHNAELYQKYAAALDANALPDVKVQKNTKYCTGKTI